VPAMPPPGSAEAPGFAEASGSAEASGFAEAPGFAEASGSPRPPFHPGATVALLTAPGVARLAAVLGTLEAGGTYVPLDPTYPRARLRFQVADAGAAVLLVTAAERALAEELLGPGGAGEAAARPAILVLEELPPAPPGWLPPAV